MPSDASATCQKVLQSPTRCTSRTSMRRDALAANQGAQHSVGRVARRSGKGGTAQMAYESVGCSAKDAHCNGAWGHVTMVLDVLQACQPVAAPPEDCDAAPGPGAAHSVATA
mmetsp:Transcript_83645/g.187049  ORF Transcript_83645/g.187049 Transcript_83645/m.187049 type:complete len:112 (+) Transcript_83645:384-719(+)